MTEYDQLMSRSDFQQVGFNFPSPLQLAHFIEKHEPESVLHETPVGGSYRVYTANECAQLIAQYNPEGHLIGCLAHLLGSGRIRAKVLGTREDQNHPLDGLVLAEFESTQVPFAFVCPLYRMYPNELKSGQSIELQTCALQTQAAIYKNEKQFLSSPLGKLSPDGSFIPSGLFRPGGETIDPPKPFAVLSGRVLDASLIKNRETKQSFWKCEVQTYGGTIAVAFNESDARYKPTTKSIVAGSFQLSAIPLLNSP